MMSSIFSRFKGKDGHSRFKSKKNSNLNQLADQFPAKPRWDDAWTRKTVDAEEIQELLRRCTKELKDRALDLPFFLLPFRPTSDPSAVRTFVRHFFDPAQALHGEPLAQELRMTEPMVIAGVMKWCWSRLQGGVVGWDSYELFKVGEQDSNMARDSFTTFIPLSVDGEARSAIIFDFFDLLSAIAAHGKMNGFGGRKLSRMASWWAFDQNEAGTGFEVGYKNWLNAADATSHLFFAYLRSLAPQLNRGSISLLPMSLQKLLQETEYPPQRPSLMQSSTNRVVMIVDTVSPTPFTLLRRANHFQYRDEDRALREWSEYDDPIQALTEECRRVLRAISAANQSQAVSSSKHSTSLRDASWSRFEDIGFASALEEEDEDDDTKVAATRRQNGLRTTPSSGDGLGRPTTPSWADFLSSGFVDDGPNNPSNLLLPPDKVLPPIETQVRQKSSQSHKPRLESDRNLEPGELASITRFDLDDAFWWVWISSLAPEETPDRKSAFGRCAVVETIIRTGRWLVMEEMVKGAAPEPDPHAYIAEKKGFFSWTRRKGVSRRKSTGKHALDKGDGLKPSTTLGFSKTSIGPDQHAKIQAAALQLQAKQLQEKQQQAQKSQDRRGRTDADVMAEKTNSVLTLQPHIVSEASPAMKWANKYDKEAIREAYLSNSNAGRGLAATAIQTNGYDPEPIAASNGYDRPPEVPAKPSPAPVKATSVPMPPPIVTPNSPSFLVPDDEPEAEPDRFTEKQLEAPRDVHPAKRASGIPAGRSTTPVPPPPPPKELESMEITRETMVSPEPDLSPESKNHQKRLHKDLKDKPVAGGFRKLFARKNRSSKVPDNAAAQLGAMGVKDEQPAAPTPEPVSPIGQPDRPITQEGTVFVTPLEQPFDPMPQYVLAPAPVVAAEPPYDPVANQPISRINTADEPISRINSVEAPKPATQFKEGPLGTPDEFIIPDESDDEPDRDSAPPPIARHPSRSPLPSPQPTGEADKPKGPVPVQDRWAQIRKNAAERAAMRQNEEKTRGGYNSAKTTATTDVDEDTSGEETIESRVARIKARVAELTGNMDGQSGSGNATPPPIRR